MCLRIVQLVIYVVTRYCIREIILQLNGFIDLHVLYSRRLRELSVYLRLSVCLSLRTITQCVQSKYYRELKPTSGLIFGIEWSKVKVAGSSSAKIYWRWSSGRRELCTLLSAQPLIDCKRFIC